MLITKLSLDRENLREVPRRERELFFAMTLLANDLSLLQRLVLLSGDPEQAGPEPIAQAQSTQAFMLLRLLAGKQLEAWKLIEKSAYKAVLGTYEADLPSLAQEALARIRQSHEAGSALKAIRDKFAFHYDAAAIGKGFEFLGSESLDIYLGNNASNCLFHCGEIVLVLAMVKSQDYDQREVNFDLAFKFIPIAGDWILLVQGFVQAFLTRYGVQGREELDIEVPRTPNGLRIPWFCEGLDQAAPNKRSEST